MPFQFHIDILDLVLKGLIIGIMASAPMGPVGVLCVQRTLNKGRWYGFVTGIGAAVSDLIYALITGLGMSFVMDLITNPRNKFFPSDFCQSHSFGLRILLLPFQSNKEHTRQWQRKRFDNS
jgi:arginine exporter protein ArgO